MTRLLKILPFLAALGAAPASAALPEAHAGHHPAPDPTKAAGPAAKPDDAKPVVTGCPMMEGGMPAGAMTGEGPGGKTMDGKMMMAGKDMHCMSQPAPAKGTDASPDQGRSGAAPK